MRDRYLSFLILGALIALCVVVVMAGNRIAGLDRSIADILDPNEGVEVQVLEETITTTGSGRKITIRTERLDNETVDAWVARHNAAIAAVQGL